MALGFKIRRSLTLIATAMLAVGSGDAATRAPTAPLLPSASMPLPTAVPGANPIEGFVPGRLTLLSIDELPNGLRQLAEKDLEDDRRGFRAVSTRELRDARAELLRAARPAKAAVDTDDASPWLDLRHSALGECADLGTIERLRVGDAPVMRTRVFRRADGAVIAFEEFRYPASPGSGVVSVRELLNSRVGPYPARLLIERSEQGLARSQLGWTTPRAKYALVVFDDVDAPREPRWDRAWLRALAASLGS